MDNSHNQTFQEIVAAAQRRAAEDMANAIPSTELPSDDNRRNHIDSRLSSAAKAGGDTAVSGEVQIEIEDASEDAVAVPMPDYIKERLENSKDRAFSNPARKPLTNEELTEFNRARAEASASLPQYPPKSRY